MRKNKLWVIALLGSWLIGLSGCAKQEIKNMNSGGKNIICFGDSLTFGYGAERGEDYPSVLSKLLGMQVINAGRDGDNSIDGLKRIDSEALNKEPRLVIIEFGANDFLDNIPRESTLSNLKEMIDKVQAKGAIAAVVDISASMLMKEYQPLYRSVAGAKGAIFIPDAFKGIITNPSLKSDFVHPNAKGYQLIAERVLAVIKPYLDENSGLRQSGQ